MECRKRRQPNIGDSVIARLMGFDELQAPQKPREKYRVLSESYVRNASSVGPRSSSLVSTGRLRVAENEVVREVKSKNNDLKKCVDSSGNKVKRGMQNRLHVLRYIQKYEDDSLSGHTGDLGFDYWKRSLEFEQVMKDGVSAIKPKSYFEVVKLDQHSRPRYRKHEKSHKPESGKGCLQIGYKDTEVNGIVHCRYSCIVCTRAMSRIFRQERPRSKFDELLKITKEVKGDEVYARGKNLNKIHALPDQNKSVVKEGIKVALSSGNQAESTERDKYLKEQLVARKDFVVPKGDKGYELFPDVNDTMLGSSKKPEFSGFYFSSSGEACIRDVGDGTDNGFKNDRCEENEHSPRNCIRTKTGPLLESIPATLPGENEHSFYDEEVFEEEAFLNSYSEEESTFSNRSRIDPPGFLGHLKGMYHQSPDSVLEQSDMQLSPTFEHFDSIDLQLQLQALDFDSEEAYSEGSLMLLSGDDDFDKCFEDLSQDDIIVKTWLHNNKSRNSSYMVGVLDEAGFCGVNSLFTDFFKIWYSAECPINPSVFEALEKKYSKQISCQQSERKLLFDRINCGLVSIFNQIMKFHTCPKSVSGLHAFLKRDEVEDELWEMLNSQDKTNDFSEKDFDKWLEAEEGITIVCGEVEMSLFDDLMMELVDSVGFE